MAIKPRNRGIQRISEREDVRLAATDTVPTIKLGKTCIGCRKYHSYIRPEEKLCTGCAMRLKDLSK